MTKARMIALALMGLSAGYAVGQTEANDTTLDLNEVVVTSYRRQPSAVGKLPVPLNKAPLTVASIGREKIELLDLRDLNDATRTATGIRPINSYGGFLYFTIRGFSDFVLLNDGIRDERHNLYQSAPSTSLASVQSVEVLKGAASVMFGHSALGGVVNVVHKQPTAERHVNAGMGIGSWGRYTVSGGASGQIAKGVNFRTDFSMSGGEGWRHTDNKAYNGWLALDFRLSDWDKLSFSVSAKDDYYGTDTGQPHFTADVFDLSGNKVWEKGDIPSYINRRTRFNDPLDHLTDKDLTVALKYSHVFGDSGWKLVDLLSYYYDDLDYYASEGLSYLTSSEPIYKHYYMNGDKRTYINTDSIRRTGFLFAYETNLLQNQLELHGKATTGSIKHDLLFAANYSNLYLPRWRSSYGSAATGAGKNAVLDVRNPVLNQGNIGCPWQKRSLEWEQDYGLHIGDYIHFTPQFTVLASLRYDYFHRNYQMVYSDHKTITSKDPKTSEHNNALTYRLSALYEFSDKINVYASMSSFFKPTRTAVADGYIYIDSDGKKIDSNVNGSVYKPISGQQYEVGSHITLGNRLQADFSAFYIVKNNMVQNLGKLEDGTNVSGQVGRADSKGLELSFQALPFDGLTVDAGYSLTIAKLREFSVTEYAANTQAGNYLQHAPKHMAYGWAFYDFPQALKGLKIGAGFNYSSKVYVNAANTMTFDPYAIANAMISYNFKKNWKLQLNFNNIFDKTYYMYAVSTTGYVPEEGRNVRFTATFNL